MVATLSKILVFSQFKNIYARKLSYMILAPLMVAYLSFCLLLNSYSFFFVSVMCYFFVLDSIAIPGPGIIADISKFYFTPKSIFKVYVNYVIYRFLYGFVFNFVPGLLIFLFTNSVLPQEEHSMSVMYCILIFCCAWVLYVIASVPMVVLAFRKNAFYQLVSMFAVPYYSIGIVVQLQVNWKLIVLQDYLGFVWALISVVFMSMTLAFIGLFRNEHLYPDAKRVKLGFK